MTSAKTSGNPLDAIKDKNKGAATVSSDKEFRVFKCARPANRLITPSGFRITFTGYKYITQNPEAIEYLEQCLEDKVPGISDEGTTTSEELNPEKALRAKHYAEFLKEQEALSANRDFGGKGGNTMKVATSKDQAN